MELLGKSLGGAADGKHGLLSRSMAPNQEDKESILGDTYHNETGRQQSRRAMRQSRK